MIVYENVTKKYGDVTVVDNLSLTIDDGEFLVLIGPSGCGKTTTLKMLNRLIKYDEGNIYIDDIDKHIDQDDDDDDEPTKEYDEIELELKDEDDIEDTTGERVVVFAADDDDDDDEEADEDEDEIEGELLLKK